MQAIITRKLWQIKAFNFLLLIFLVISGGLFFLYGQNIKKINMLENKVFELEMEKNELAIDALLEEENNEDYDEQYYGDETQSPFMPAVWFEEKKFYGIKINVV